MVQLRIDRQMISRVRFCNLAKLSGTGYSEMKAGKSR